jgi:predicted nucleic acid-binding protein
MPVLNYLADTNAISDYGRNVAAVRTWFDAHKDEIAISTLTLAEIRRGIELKLDGKAKRELERKYRYIVEDYSGAIFVFDEAAAVEWGRLMAEARNHPLPFGDSLVGAIARSAGLKMVTRNTRHFPGCETVNPWTAEELPAWTPS